MQPTQISNTAAFIAVKFYGLTRDDKYRSLFGDDMIAFYEQLVQRLPAPHRYYHSGLQYRALRRFFMFWEELLLPGDLMHILLRKWYLTKWVDDLHRRGYRQMLVLGSGFDHLAALNAQKGIRSVELDTPWMINRKQNFINECGYHHPNLNLREAFFTRDSLQEVLQMQPMLDPSQKTIIIAEGFFDYFDPPHCSRFLADLNTYFTSNLTLLSTIFSLQELSGFRASVYKNSIKLAGEQLKLHLNQPGYLSFLEEQGFSVNQCLGYNEMKKEVLEPKGVSLPVLPGFYLVRAGK